ncbi:PREDICTED: adenylate kinase 7-like [Acropora digitifera]|uniref:adenylate kinase 7-like n=1 Tax=Acropora digitifera TaxID=70779 RepID=UPI00077B0A1B|nr:PREDICTED: adenylate kinase 7-like [Acropora digitifera]
MKFIFLSALHAELENFKKLKVFICLSTVMTWARSKPLDPDDPEIAFTEDDYRRRRAHPNFKSHISAEKLVIKHGKTNKAKFITYVVASGLTYGGGEEIFHFLFKTAWHGQAPALQCFGNGQNVVPTIHIKDLAAVIVNICDQNPKVRYLVAVDDSKNTLEEIVKAVSSNLGNGKVKNISKEEALLIKELEQADFDMLLVNLRMDATYIKEGMNITWVAELGLLENIEKVIKEYKESRGLLIGRFEDQYIIRFYRDKLHSMPCQNQGFILDGYPKTFEQAKELFAVEDGDEGEEDSPLSYDKLTMPGITYFCKDFLRSRTTTSWGFRKFLSFLAQLAKERKEREERERRDAEEAAERQRREEEWRVRLSEVKRQEQELLENQSVPLRNYLMKHVMPTLAQGLIECCKMRPDDPVDYLAEYLFKNNPQID